MGKDSDKKAVSILAPTNEPKKEKEEGEKEKKKEEKKKKTKKEQQDDLSEEDRKKKEEIDSLVEKLQDPQENVCRSALSSMRSELQTATSSMTSVPKPLKFLQPHFHTLVNFYDNLPLDSEFRKPLADVLSVLSTTCAEEGSRRMLRYRLEGTCENLSAWSDEYMRNLSAEITAEYNDRQKDNLPVDELLKLVYEMVEYYMHHGAECDAVDLLCEVDKIEKIKEFIDDNTYKRCVLYLLSMSNFAASYEECLKMLNVVFDMLLLKKAYPDALRVSMKMNDVSLMRAVLRACEDELTKKQLLLICARQRISLDTLDIDEQNEQLAHLYSGDMMSTNFQFLAKELDVLEPKLPEDVYKTHLEERRGVGAALDSAKQNLAATFVNAFVNAAFCKDKLMTVDGSSWLYKNKDHGMLSAAASMGVLLLWNIDDGLCQIDKFQYSSDMYIKAGALMAFGLVSSGVKNDCDPAFALLSEHLDSTNSTLKLGAIIGLGYAYAGTRREDLLEVLAPCVIDTSFTVECSAMAALSLGLIFVGSCNQEAAEAILQTILERQATDASSLDGSIAIFFAVGLGLLYLCSRDSCEVTITALEAIEHPLGKYAACTVEGMAYANSGDVLKVQRMLQICVEKRDASSASSTSPASSSTTSGGSGGSANTASAASSTGAASSSTSTSSSSSSSSSAASVEDEEMRNIDKAVAVLNLPLIAMGEDVGSEMVLRTFDHLLQYGEINERRGIPLALALHSASNPRPTVVDLLSKLSHDPDADVALHAIISLGFVGAGTNNSRIAGLLRQLAAFYAKDANAMFVVRIAQGLLYIGKGLMSINPLHSDRFLINPVSLGCLLAVLHACLHLKNTILGRQHYLMYHLVPAMYPRMLMTVDEELNPLSVSVRVGQAVDTVGQAGQPKTITGFQTHTTPVLLSYGDRAELATEEYIAMSSVLEGVVILKKNPDYKPSATAT